MKRGAALANALLTLLGCDLLTILITGTRSPLQLGASVGTTGFVLRVVLFGLLLLARFRMIPPPEKRMSGARTLLFVLLLGSLVQFQVLGSRLTGDGLSYYVFLRSLMKDRDFDLANEYAHYGMITRRDLAGKTTTGLRRSIYSIGPAVVWAPFFLLGEGLARAEGLVTGREPDLSGYGPHHYNAVALGGLLLGFAGIVLVHTLLLRYFSAATALGATLLMWGATFLHWYLVVQPTYSHGPSALLAAYAIWLWDRDRSGGRAPAWAHFFLGTILGLAMCVRWQNGVLLALPGLELLRRLLKERAPLRDLVKSAALLGLGVFVGVFPQMAAWKALYDIWVLPCPPQGCEFLRLDHPWILETLFTSRHGLLSWTPVLWAGYFGLIPLYRRRPDLAAMFAPLLLLMTYVNMCVGDWWGGASFSNRRFDSVLPMLAFGLAASIDASCGILRRWPTIVVGLAILPFVVWNLALAAQLRRGLVSTAETASFPRLAGQAADLVSAAVGFPTTWPASWIFAWRHRRPPAQYDLLVGRYLFYRQNSLNGRIDLGTLQSDEMLGEGWGPVESQDGAAVRCLQGRGRLFASLDVPEAIELGFRASAPAGDVEASVRVNGHDVGAFRAGRARDTSRLRAPASLWRREINEVELQTRGGAMCLDFVEFARFSRRWR